MVRHRASALDPPSSARHAQRTDCHRPAPAMKFGGLVYGLLSMDAITRSFTGRRGRCAIQAGNDIVLHSPMTTRPRR
jgi:hypothetical protein